MGWLDRLIRWFVPPAPGPVRPPAPIVLASASQVVAALNRVRASRAPFAPPVLAEDPVLDRVAATRARAMAARGSLDHAGYYVAIREALPAAVDEGECLAEGSFTAEALVAFWLGDPPHRALVLGPYNRVGCGVARAVGGSPYWVADFAQV